jgi:hypothetical protein
LLQTVLTLLVVVVWLLLFVVDERERSVSVVDMGGG